MTEEQALNAMLSIAEEMDADALDKLISALAEVRSKKLPAVSQTRPGMGDPSTLDTIITMEDDPSMMAIRLRDGRVRVWARSSGFGWLAFNLPMTNALLLKDWFNANLDGNSDLLSDSGGQAH
ncbi:hypothetical protein [Acidovorax sp. Leaf78]|uniref:hypothetical protein n=1 Tax=Acidovorax sp. Leaf78 TaxID=1736237 RepID=UPI0006F59FAC|nr:hypothetical protein [Acidovorax sp. Leaf78]KQO23479.1 hypothetical protein ASF16_04770 [Acidovorax sp. Leaf78]